MTVPGEFMQHLSIFKQFASSFAICASLAASAHAESKGASVPNLPKYQQECAACHLAFPPGMLPAASWQRIMGTLNQHYGADASLDDATTHEIGAWLKTHAGTYKRVSEAPPQDRISKSAWFLQKHRPGEVPADAWKRVAVGSPANCAACHRNAAQGSFNEREISIPK
jgi:hypothetical protein